MTKGMAAPDIGRRGNGFYRMARSQPIGFV